MNKIQLVGDIGDKFGKEWHANVANLSEILRLIECQTEGFKEYLIKSEENGIGFVIQRAGDYINDESELLLNLNEEDIIITAVPLGAGKGGFLGSGLGKIILGVALVILGWYAPNIFGVATETGVMMTKVGVYVQKTLYTVGTSLITQGVTQLLMSTPDENKSEDGYLFGAGTGTVATGQPVPLAYGQVLIQGVPLSASFTTQKPNLSVFTYSDRNSNSTTGASYYTSVGSTQNSVEALEILEDYLEEEL